MKPLAFTIVALLLYVSVGLGQPMSGNYTVGGTSPDFATPQDAANALKACGVSGPVTINIRPGTYMRQGSPGVVIKLDTVVAGVSPTNRITFQPDIAAGGNPSNVILQIDCDISLPQPADRVVAVLGPDYVTLHNLTFRDADSLDKPAAYLVRALPVVFANPTIEGLVVEGCTFIGTPYYTHGQQFGTDMGVYAGGGLSTARITNSRFTNLMRACSFDFDSAPSGDSLIVEDNRFDHLYGGSTGSGNPLGTAIEVVCSHPVIRGNFVSQSSGSIGIVAVYPISGIFDRNYVQGDFRNGQLVVTETSNGLDRTDSLLIRNNITMGTGTFHIRTRNTKLFHNTIVFTGPVGALDVIKPQCVVMNNIILSYGGFLGYDQLGATGLVSDHNVIFRVGINGHLIRAAGGQIFETLASYQSATGLDVNSHFTDVSFSSDSLGIHLDKCGAQNSALDGIPLPEVPFDFYGALRDSLKPFVGAVEGVRLPYDMFAAPFKSGLSGFALSLAQGRFEDVWGNGIAVPDWDNRQVLLFHNEGVSRTFTQIGSLSTGFRPTIVRFFDLDGDNHQDLIVAGDTSAASLEVFWGDGTGNFSGPASVQTAGRVRSLEPGPGFTSVPPFSTIVTTEDNGFLPGSSFIGFTTCTAARELCHELTNEPDPPDTIHEVMEDFVLADLGRGGSGVVTNMVAPGLFGTSNAVPKFLAIDIVAAGDVASRCQLTATDFRSSAHGYDFPVTGYYTNSSSIVVGDFDGDSDNDFITTGWDDNYCVLVRNQGSQGNLAFSADTIPTSSTRGLAKLDYDNDGDLDFITVNNTLDSAGITIFLNNGTGNFTEKKNCFFPFASGHPNGIVAADFDGDSKTDIAVVSRSLGGGDSLFVLYNLGGFNGTTSVQPPHSEETPQTFTLFQNYPNPFNPSTRIEYSLPSQSHVSIKIYNLLGQEVATLIDEQQVNGTHVVEWNGKSTNGFSVSTGVYFYRIEARQPDGQFAFANVKKMILVK